MTNTFATLRTVLASFALAVAAIGIVAGYLASSADDDGVSVAAATVVVGAAGVGLLVTSWRLGGRPLDCAALAASYRSRFFVRVAVAEAAALVGFVAVLLSGSVLPYVVGAACAFAGFALAAPTANSLDRDQAQLLAAGCGASLHEALGL